ncbi:hypothetical protein QF117_04060 [Vibrio sp. YMD68]|uniref:hypothetical protein n=1 Tax=Vibrio sp. YMD68 TaxID=3042300 RepID=UPI00249C2DE5|nr:hypothetical protein [Vibrio sp. YMD68]WGV98040.1 hypothetical protein QF117_04060 [Vibrio sp. YMD68]
MAAPLSKALRLAVIFWLDSSVIGHFKFVVLRNFGGYVAFTICAVKASLGVIQTLTVTVLKRVSRTDGFCLLSNSHRTRWVGLFRSSLLNA